MEGVYFFGTQCCRVGNQTIRLRYSLSLLVEDVDTYQIQFGLKEDKSILL